MMVIQNFEHFLAAWREQKIMSTDRVFADRKHTAAVVGVQHVASRQINLGRVVNASARRQAAGEVSVLEGKQVGDLLTVRI